MEERSWCCPFCGGALTEGGFLCGWRITEVAWLAVLVVGRSRGQRVRGEIKLKEIIIYLKVYKLTRKFE